MKFTAPNRDPEFANNRLHGALAQREFLNRVLLHCKNFRTAVDAGAHIGICTDILASRFEEVWAFEPTEENYKCLQDNIGSRAALENVALGSFLDFGVMTLPRDANSGMWYMKQDDEGGVPIVPLDSYELLGVDLIKIDVEGFEGCVIDGARETISRSKPVIVFEDNGNGEKYFGAGWTDPKPVLKALGYERKTRINKDEIWVPCKFS